MSKQFNGYPSWNAWNVSLWINNDEGLYRLACDMVKEYGKGKAADVLAELLSGQETPDGAVYSRRSVALAIRDIA